MTFYTKPLEVHLFFKDTRIRKMYTIKTLLVIYTVRSYPSHTYLHTLLRHTQSDTPPSRGCTVLLGNSPHTFPYTQDHT